MLTFLTPSLGLSGDLSPPLALTTVTAAADAKPMEPGALGDGDPLQLCTTTSFSRDAASEQESFWLASVPDMHR